MRECAGKQRWYPWKIQRQAGRSGLHGTADCAMLYRHFVLQPSIYVTSLMITLVSILFFWCYFGTFCLMQGVEDILKVFAVNTFGPFVCCREAARQVC